ncbi:tetratricopeptide repeat protein [Stakelama marina]|uniref:Tetratricopeptide repeat protein n=1 Tax=Stakelama marina TaxID=2826939 RepID=A0A8T4IM10_9SPHN|nr:tetratricopeptide repeat protein [Stakelama marina]MBR0553196.1 tetratricopeptide repeat protein [Stakelama marina]
MLALLVLTTMPGAARADDMAARDALARSLTYLKAGNASAARSQAFKATQEASNWGLAHAVLARSQLALGEGVAAEGELDRAISAGFDKRRSYQLYAHAYLLQGQTEQALAALDKADPRYLRYTLRIRAMALAAQGDVAGAERAFAQALAIAPHDVRIWTDLGEMRFENGNLAGAIDASRRAVATDRDDAEALVLRGKMVREQFGLVAALPWFEAALRQDPWRHDALIEYAATLGDVGRNTDMLAAVRKAMLARPGSPQGYYLQAVLAARAGKYDLARSILQRAGDALSDLPGALLLQGAVLVETGSYGQATETLRELVARQPMNLSARKLLALAYLRAGSASDALDILKPMAQRADADAYTLTLSARAFEAAGNRVMAAHLLDRAAMPATGQSDTFGADDSLAVLSADAAETPEAADTVVPLVRALLDHGDTRTALSRARQAAQDAPGAPEGQLLVGDVLMAMKRFGDAASAYARAADLRFDESTMLRLVEARDAAGESAAARDALALFLSQNPENSTALRLAGKWQLAAGDANSAIVTLEALRSRIGDRDAGLLSDLASAYGAAGEHDAARRYAAAAYSLAPANPAVADAYGWAMFEAGDDDGARQLIEKAVAIAPDHAGLRWHLGQVYAALDRKKDAVANIRLALANPGFGDRDAAQALLKHLA